MTPGSATGPASIRPPVRAELARKALHLSSAALPIAWGVGVVASADVRWLLGAACATALLLEGVRRLSPAVQRGFLAGFGPLLRPHERTALTGATWLAVAMLTSALLLPQDAAIAALWAAAVGDGLASVVGRLASRDDDAKTWAGSVTCAVATAVGAWWLAAIAIAPALLVGVAAAAAERPRLAVDDNVRVAAAAGLAAWVLSVA